MWEKATPLSGTARHVIIDGAAPAWLVTSITHAVHPASVSLADPKVKGGKVPIYTPRPSGSGRFLVYKAQYFEEFCMVKFVIPGGILDPADLPLIAPPRIQSGKGVVLSGRGPNWLSVSLAMGYAHYVPWVGLYQPGMGATVTITHSKDYKLGEIVAITEGKPSVG